MQHFSQLNIYAISLVLKVFLNFSSPFCKEFLLHLRSTLFTFNIITTLSFLFSLLFPRDAFNIFRNNDQSFLPPLILSIIVKLELKQERSCKGRNWKVFFRLIVFFSCFRIQSYVGNRNWRRWKMHSVTSSCFCSNIEILFTFLWAPLVEIVLILWIISSRMKI